MVLYFPLVERLLFERVCATTEKSPRFNVSTLGTKSTLVLDDRSCLCLLAGVSNECKYVGVLRRRCRNGDCTQCRQFISCPTIRVVKNGVIHKL